MPNDHDRAYNRDDQLKPGRPPRAAQEPAGAEGSARTAKTLTDPISGRSERAGHAPDQARADQADGAAKRKGRRV